MVAGLETIVKGEEQAVRLLFLGDTILKSRNGGDPFSCIEESFHDKDFIVINLETSIVFREKEHTLQQKSVTIKSYADELFWLLKYKGKFVFTLANNHVYDCGEDGYQDTLKFLRENGFRFVAGDSPYYLEKGSARVRLDAVYQGILNDYSRSILSFKNEYQDDCFNVLCVHWGLENVLMPSVEQIDAAHKWFRRGVHLIVGHHSHTPQGRLSGDGRLCAFLLGNLNMLHCTGEPRMMERTGLMLEVEIADSARMEHRLIPVRLDPCFIPEPENSEAVKNLINQLDGLIPQSESYKKRRYRLVYECHVSRNFLWDNMKHGWFPRLVKYGGAQWLMMFRWLVSKRVLFSFFFLLFNGLTRADKIMKALNKGES